MTSLSRSPLDIINSYYQNIYIKPYCRIGPYIVGILLAYAMSGTGSKNIKISKVSPIDRSMMQS